MSYQNVPHYRIGHLKDGKFYVIVYFTAIKKIVANDKQ